MCSGCESYSICNETHLDVRELRELTRHGVLRERGIVSRIDDLEAARSVRGACSERSAARGGETHGTEGGGHGCCLQGRVGAGAGDVVMVGPVTRAALSQGAPGLAQQRMSGRRTAANYILVFGNVRSNCANVLPDSRRGGAAVSGSTSRRDELQVEEHHPR